MLRKITVITLVVLGTIVIFGCAATPRLDKNWGKSLEAAKTAQTLNPDADKNLEPVEGLQGPVVEKILENHLMGKEQEKKKTSGIGVLTIQK